MLKVIYLVGLFLIVAALSYIAEQRKPPLPPDYEEEFIILDGERLKPFCFGLEGLVADYYWMQTLQYFGKKILDAKSRDQAINIEDLRALNPKMLYPLLENVVSFDPKFTDAYLFASLVLPTVDTEKAIELAERGIKNSPEDWRLYHYLGFIYWKKGDYEKASEIYERGSLVEDAPPFMKMMSAKLKVEGGSRSVAREIYKRMYDESNSAQIKESIELRLLWIDALDEMDVIRQALNNYKQRTGACVRNWQELIAELKRMPQARSLRIKDAVYDPSGVAYKLDTESCDVSLDQEKTKLPLR
ncbi:MAG: hypothetical protein N2Z23_04430 [Pyrinomonadaceae bacterium]|nr:hypothetical protein [Pyrinomonadaceae bacterium]MCX7639670.1 hypothetical protein [Pyrinomonadaceae bacterium]MDW8303312.1 hypothetical protein [Acidobacteriota bacterium]